MAPKKRKASPFPPVPAMWGMKGAPKFRAVTVPITCVNECGRQSALALPGEGPYEGGTFVHPGWSAVNEPGSGDLVFVCPTCFEAERKKESGSLIRQE